MDPEKEFIRLIKGARKKKVQVLLLGNMGLRPQSANYSAILGNPFGFSSTVK